MTKRFNKAHVIISSKFKPLIEKVIDRYLLALEAQSKFIVLK
jgi:hypothetical protein